MKYRFTPSDPAIKTLTFERESRGRENATLGRYCNHPAPNCWLLLDGHNPVGILGRHHSVPVMLRPYRFVSGHLERIK